MCSDPIDAEIAVEVVPSNEIPADKMGLDIGTETAKLYADAVKSAKTVVWNGRVAFFKQIIDNIQLIRNFCTAQDYNVTGEAATKAVEEMKEGAVVLLLNTRFSKFLLFQFRIRGLMIKGPALSGPDLIVSYFTYRLLSESINPTQRSTKPCRRYQHRSQLHRRS